MISKIINMKIILNLSYLIPLLALFMAQSFGQVMDSVKSGEHTIYYELKGEGDPIYILAGGPGISPRYINGIAEELSERFQTVVVHQRGTGSSAIPVNEENIQIDKYCEDINSIKKKLGHDKISLLGHSWGGMLAMHYMTSFPNNINQTILVSSGGYNLNYHGYFYSNIWSHLSENDQKALNAYNEFIAQSSEIVPSDSLRDVLKEYLAIMVKGYLFDKSKAEEVRRISDINMEISPLMMGSLARANWNLKDKLIEIENSRTLIIQGRQDPIDLETARQINDAINGSQLKIIEKCGHFPWIERPNEFYAILKDFLINN